MATLPPMSTQIDSPPAQDALVRAGLPPMPRANVVGTDLGLTDYEGTMDWMDEVIRRGERACVTAAAVHLVMVAREDPETRRSVDVALAVPDGVPLVRALRALGHPQATRVYGPDLMAAYCDRSARTGTTMFLYGGRSDEALRELTDKLIARSPGLRIVGGWSPPFRPLTDAERDDVAARINASGADVVWVGTGQPKQEKWMAEMRERLDAAIPAGGGGAGAPRRGVPRRRRRRVRLPRRDRAPGARVDAAPRAGVDLPSRARAAPAVAALRALQPALRRRVRAPVRRAPRRSLTALRTRRARRGQPAHAVPGPLGRHGDVRAGARAGARSRRGRRRQRDGPSKPAGGRGARGPAAARARRALLPAGRR